MTPRTQYEYGIYQHPTSGEGFGSQSLEDGQIVAIVGPLRHWGDHSWSAPGEVATLSTDDIRAWIEGLSTPEYQDACDDAAGFEAQS